MTKLQTMLAFAVALTVGASMFGVDPAHAQLGNGSAAIGGGGEAIGRGAPDTASSEASKASAPRVFGQCITNRTAYRTQTNLVSTTSQTFATMPNTHFPVTHAAGCLIVDFTSEITQYAAENMLVRAWIGGIGAASPAEAYLGRVITLTHLEARSMRFVFPNVPAGTHTVRIEWRVTGGTGLVQNRTLTVQHR